MFGFGAEISCLTSLPCAQGVLGDLRRGVNTQGGHVDTAKYGNLIFCTCSRDRCLNTELPLGNMPLAARAAMFISRSSLPDNKLLVSSGSTLDIEGRSNDGCGPCGSQRRSSGTSPGPSEAFPLWFQRCDFGSLGDVLGAVFLRDLWLAFASPGLKLKSRASSATQHWMIQAYP